MPSRKPPSSTRARFFATAAAWREWLEEHHATETELLVGFYKVKSGRPSMRWPESVDQALCFGWIDGVRKSIDAFTYSIRFSVRRKGSIWSNINIAKAEALLAAGRMKPAGWEIFRRRVLAKSGVYSFEQKLVELDDRAKQKFMELPHAWSFFQAQPPSYRRIAIWHVLSARLPTTRERRLAKIISASAQCQRI